MRQLEQKPAPQAEDQTTRLEKEIAALEKELQKVEQELNIFTSQIRAQLHVQTHRVRELTELYKKQKAAKRAKRLEQKKRGKNYHEPQGLKLLSKDKNKNGRLSQDEQQELKKLYKETMLHVHPDKFANEDEDKTHQANNLTAHLNGIYDSGDLDELKSFHQHIISGNAMSHVPYQPETTADSKAMVAYLRKKKEELTRILQETKESQLYTVLKTYPDTRTFIDEVRLQFEDKIVKLEKRTRKG
ncbi:hypothetical protein [Pontibacter silvestris]|nr:hypothetical protein [Pontibacter silvestris]MCC9138324.1 hypothetical protein [Pontibacter silvestris]